MGPGRMAAEPWERGVGLQSPRARAELHHNLGVRGGEEEYGPEETIGASPLPSFLEDPEQAAAAQKVHLSGDQLNG
ncbi:hypothetical protein CapIbe_021084 [Capra ibex]